MKIGAVDLPEPLLSALRNGELVVFAGAGVSMGRPADLPGFERLARRIAVHTGLTPKDHEPIDDFLGRLQEKGAEVHRLAARELSRGAPTDLHRHLLRLFGSPEAVRIVTTNFDELFERAALDVFGGVPRVLGGPELPLGMDFAGIVHVHGSVQVPRQMVLTDVDFGRAYLTDGWARRFLLDLFQKYTVLFVGYGHRDVVFNYLARALPPSASDRRYALVGEKSGNAAHWDQLRIKRIIYPQRCQDDHRVLTAEVRTLAEWMRRDVFERRKEIRALAADPPPLDEQQSERLAYALQEPENVRFFTESADSSKWIEWLEERGYLDGLFDDFKYGERERLIGNWLLRRFGADEAAVVFSLVARHGYRLAGRFWRNAYFELFRKAKVSMSNETLSQWVSVLLESLDLSPRDSRRGVVAASRTGDDVNAFLVRIAERCAKQGHARDLVRVFETFLASLLCSMDVVRVRDLIGSTVDEQYSFSCLWKGSMEPHLPEIAEPLLACSIGLLERRQRLLEIWCPDDEGTDRELASRAAIEPHERDLPERRGPVDMAIDAARDALDWLGEHQDGVAISWCQRLIRSPSTALRRLAVHGLMAERRLSSDQRIDWLLDNTNLQERALRHEIFRVAKASYAHVPDEQRQRFVQRVLEFVDPATEDVHPEFAARAKLDWLAWLDAAAPDCPYVESSIGDIRSQFPQVEPSDQPDLGRPFGPPEMYRIERLSPWPAAEMLGWDPEEFVARLPAELPDHEVGPDGLYVNLAGGLADEIVAAVKTDPRWGLGGAKALLSRARLEVPFWPDLLRSLSEADEEVLRDILSLFRVPELQRAYSGEIAHSLCVPVKEQKPGWVGPLLPDVLEIAAELAEVARLFGPVRGEPGFSQGWPGRASETGAAPLLEVWLQVLRLLHRDGRAVPGNTAYGKVLDALAGVVADTSDFGAASTSILAGEVPRLLALEGDWAKDELVPLFDSETRDSAKAVLHEAVWDGFLFFRQFDRPPDSRVASILKPSLLRLTPFLNTFPVWKQEAFLRCTTTMMVYSSEGPLTEWLPLLFDQFDEGGRIRFAREVETRLLLASSEDGVACWRRWLRRYWLNRIDGVPAVLTAGETAAMFNWLPRLAAVFDEAVRVAVEMKIPDAELPRVSVGEVRDMLRVADRAAPLAKLALRLDEFTLSPWDDYDLDKLLAGLLEAELSEETSCRLTKVAVRRGVLK